jgi:hypothetical protein
MITYKLVSEVDGSLIAEKFTEENVLAAMEIRGFDYLKPNRTGRSELVGQPIFRNVLGPMYDGPGVVRYETAAAYKTISA